MLPLWFLNLINAHFGKILGALLQFRLMPCTLCVCVCNSYQFDIFNLVCFNCSNFSNVFDEDHFISSLANDVKIIRKLPMELTTATRGVKHIRSWSGIDYYQEEIASLWEEYQVYLVESDFYLSIDYFDTTYWFGKFSRSFEQRSLILGWQTITYLQTFRSCGVVLVMKPSNSHLELKLWER